MGENERQRTFLAPQPPSAPKHSNPSVRRPSVSDGGVTSKQSENQDRPSQPARGILKQFAVTFGDGFAEDMDENPFASFAAPPADVRYLT